ncbi:MAG: alpha/beta fold hydrolase [Ignavibacterium sp.]
MKKINGLSVFEFGEPANPAIIFIHGFPYSHKMWLKQIDKLKEKYFCVTYDIRGLGESEVGDGQYTIESFVDDLMFVIDELKLNKPVLCGLSMGGYISFRAIEKDEKKFSAVIFCDTKSNADSNEAKITRANNIKRINKEGLNNFVAEFIANCFYSESINILGNDFIQLIDEARNFNPIGVKGCLLAMMGRTDTTEYLSKIKIPTLLLCGEYDKLTPSSAMKEIAEKINKSEFYIVPNAGHITPIENSEFVLDKISKFLQSIYNK